MSRRDLLTSRGWLKTRANAFVVASKTHSHLDPFIEFLKSHQRQPKKRRRRTKLVQNSWKTCEESPRNHFQWHLGVIRVLLWTYWELGGVMESSWNRPGKVLEAFWSCLGVVLGRPGGVCAAICGDFERRSNLDGAPKVAK